MGCTDLEMEDTEVGGRNSDYGLGYGGYGGSNGGNRLGYGGFYSGSGPDTVIFIINTVD